MSATRIVKRRAWRESPMTNKRPVTYHQRCVENGERHPTFQKRVRAARAAMGHRQTSTDMHHFEADRF